MAVNTKKLKQKTFGGVSALVARSFLSQPISFFGFIFLSVYLQTWELGVFWAVSEVVGFLGYFSDIGLAAAIIQKKEEPTKKELRSTFTVQQCLVITGVLIAFGLTSFLEKRFDFDNGRFLYWILLFGFFTSSLKTIPSVLLERRLSFKKIALVDLIEQIIFTSLAVFLAWRGFGVNSWAWAVLARSLAGVILINFLSPWPFGFSLDFKAVKDLFSFGLPFQANSLLSMFKDRLMNIFLWGSLGSVGVGVLGWAQRWAQLPLRFLMDSVIRVTFPAYAKLQTEKESLRRALEKSSFLINLLILPILAGMGFLMPKVVSLFPRYQKWSIGIVPFWLYLGNFAWGAITTPLVNAFNSVGKVKTTLKLMIFWTSLTWTLVPWLAKTNGVNGAAWGLFLVSTTSFIAWILAKREFSVSFKKILAVPVGATLLMVLSLFLLDMVLAASMAELVILVLGGGLVYLIFALALAREELLWLVNAGKQWLKKRR